MNEQSYAKRFAVALDKVAANNGVDLQAAVVKARGDHRLKALYVLEELADVPAGGNEPNFEDGIEYALGVVANVVADTKGVGKAFYEKLELAVYQEDTDGD
jgi:hypothetical protein